MAFGEDEDFGGKPVEEGKTYEVEIEDLGSKGDGIARVDNFVVFVPDTEVGERVEVEINSVGRKFAFGDVIERLGEVEDIEAEEPTPAGESEEKVGEAAEDGTFEEEPEAADESEEIEVEEEGSAKKAETEEVEIEEEAEEPEEERPEADAENIEEEFEEELDEEASENETGEGSIEEQF